MTTSEKTMFEVADIVPIAIVIWTIGIILYGMVTIMRGKIAPALNKPKYKLIGLSGKFGVGKDTAAEFIRAEYSDYCDYKIVPFADALKRVVSIMTCTSYESQFTRDGKAHVPLGYRYSVGKYQQIIGTIGREQFCDDIWIDIAINDPAEYKIIPDVRYPNEVEAIIGAGGIVIRIIRSGVELNDGRDVNHNSEIALDHYRFDHLVVNGGTLEELKEKILWHLE